MELEEAVNLVCEEMDELSEAQIARIHHEASEEAYERKLTTERMIELISG